MMTTFWLCFVPLFVAVDPIGLVPLFIAFTDGIERTRVKKIILQSLMTAFIIGWLFLWGGDQVMNFLGITSADFMVAGGTLLFVLSLIDILSSEKPESHSVSDRIDPDVMGAVPIGIPLIAGPGVLTALVLFAGQYGATPTCLAFVANLIITGVLLLTAAKIHKILGKAGTRALSKVAALLMAAIGIMIVRKGIVAIIEETSRNFAGH